MLTAHRWIPKAIAQKALSGLGMLPLYHRAQQIGGRLKDFHPNSRIEYAAKLAVDIGLEHLDGANVVEIGTGWVPVVPIALHLLGVRSIKTFDLNPHLQPELTMHALKLFPECLEELAKRSGASIYELERRMHLLSAARTFQDLTQLIDLSYHAPEDFSGAGLEADSVDIIYSNLVLEHVTPEALIRILRESHRVSRPGARCWHNVDFTDHYSHTHRGLSHINFLRYSESFWNRIGQNDILYQNRMRRSDYVRLFKRAGYEIVNEDRYYADAIDVPLSEPFRLYDRDDLFCPASRFVLQKWDGRNA